MLIRRAAWSRETASFCAARTIKKRTHPRILWRTRQRSTNPLHRLQKQAPKADPRKSDEDPVGKVYDSRLMGRLGHYLLPYWWQAAVSSISVTLKSLSDVAGPFLVMVGIDHYFPCRFKQPLTPRNARLRLRQSGSPRRLSSDPVRGITQLAGIYLCLQISAYLFEFIQTYLMQWTGQKIMFDLRRDIFRHMQRMHVGFFDTHAVGRLVTRLTSDVDAINEMFTGGILAIVDDFFTLTIMAIVMLSINWWLALLAFAVLPLILIVTRLFRNSVRESYRRVRAAIARINSFTQEHISGMARGAALQSRRARLQRLRSRQPPAHDRVQRHDLRLRALLSGGRNALVHRHRPGHLARRIRRALRHRHHRHAGQRSTCIRSASGGPSRT